jgi:RimJ/RimL family protein N-acetyltransferase
VGYPERIVGSVGVYERWDPARHTDAFAALNADPVVTEFLGGPMARAASDELSARIADHWRTFGFGLWACVDGAECVGFSGACRPGPHWSAFGAEVEIGWRLARHAWGRGFATEGARLALAPLREHLGLERVVSFIAPGNDRSRAVARRLGMEVCGASSHSLTGQHVDVYELALTRAEVAA